MTYSCQVHLYAQLYWKVYLYALVYCQLYLYATGESSLSNKPRVSWCLVPGSTWPGRRSTPPYGPSKGTNPFPMIPRWLCQEQLDCAHAEEKCEETVLANEGEEKLLEQFWAANIYVAGCYDKIEDFESLVKRWQRRRKSVFRWSHMDPSHKRTCIISPSLWDLFNQTNFFSIMFVPWLPS